jgi:adenosine kinase
MGIFSIFDPGQSLPAWHSDGLAMCISQSNLLVSNDYELALIKEKTGLSDHALLELAGAIVTTKGAQGCEVSNTEGLSVSIPVVPTDNVVDPTGAGDAFRGGLIKGLIQGLPVERAAMMGTVCSHYAVQIYGTQTYRFTQDEFKSKLEQHFGAA